MNTRVQLFSASFEPMMLLDNFQLRRGVSFISLSSAQFPPPTAAFSPLILLCVSAGVLDGTSEAPVCLREAEPGARCAVKLSHRQQPHLLGAAGPHKFYSNSCFMISVKSTSAVHQETSGAMCEPCEPCKGFQQLDISTFSN